MARYYSRRRRYTRPYSVAFRFGRTRRSFRRQNAAAIGQRDIARFMIRARTTHSLGILNTKDSAAGAVIAFAVLESSPLFGTLSHAFDQVKVNGIRVKLVPTGV